MALPVQSLRAAPEHRDILQKVAVLLREGKANELRRLLDDVSARPVGPFKSEEAALGFIKSRLATALKPRMIWLFGSRARRDHHPDSDFDILVVLQNGLLKSDYSPWAVAAPLVASGLNFDVVGCSLSDFEAERDAPGSIVRSAVREGRLLYDAERLEALLGLAS